MQPKKVDAHIVKSRFLESCDVPLEEYAIEPFTMVIFGGSGDLSRRKLLPTIYQLYRQKKLPEDFSILSFSQSKRTDEEYRDLIKQAVEEFTGEGWDQKAWDGFSKHLFYLSSDFQTQSNYEKLCQQITKMEKERGQESKHIIFYLAVPPNFVPTIVDMLAKNSLCRKNYNSRIVIEKPFGRDKASAGELNKHVLKAFDESGGNFDKPSKEDILKAMQKLAEFSKGFRNKGIIEKHYKEIKILTDKL